MLIIRIRTFDIPKSTIFLLFSETDYPPKANAGSDVILYMPKNSVILYGNQSTDDKAIVSYEWSKSTEEDHTADMTVRDHPRGVI